MPLPLEAIEFNIRHWEGGYQNMEGDPGNWVNGVNIGTMHGVTPAAFAAFEGVSLGDITVDRIKAVTWDVAAQIGKTKYYDGWIDSIKWNATADVVCDFGWGSGPGQAIKSTERDLLGLDNADFHFDARSVARWLTFHEEQGSTKALWKFYSVRETFYDLICARNSDLQQFRIGWGRRSKWFTPAPDSEWWAHWSGVALDLPDGSAKSAGFVMPPRHLISEGMVGADVFSIQNALKTLSHKPFAALVTDGIFGPATTEAVKEFQQMRGIGVDGWVGPETRRFLFGAEHA